MAGVYHNSAYIIDTDGSEAGLYRKMHIPDDPHFTKFYLPRRFRFQNHPHTKGKIGTLICWDQWYPEAARLTFKWVRSFVLSNSNRMASRRERAIW
jgi:N-carbamoylputrescine amidase